MLAAGDAFQRIAQRAGQRQGASDVSEEARLVFRRHIGEPAFEPPATGTDRPQRAERLMEIDDVGLATNHVPHPGGARFVGARNDYRSGSLHWMKSIEKRDLTDDKD